jgi:hypothetical protein
MRYLKAILACIGLLIIFGVIGYAAGLFESDPSKQAAKNAFRVAFIIAAILTWRAATKRPKGAPGDLVPRLVERAADEQRKIETRHSNEASELEYLERRVPELKASLLRMADSEQRLRDFQPVLDGKFRCPRCWIADGVHRDLTQKGVEDSLTVKCEAPGCKVSLTTP